MNISSSMWRRSRSRCVALLALLAIMLGALPPASQSSSAVVLLTATDGDERWALLADQDQPGRLEFSQARSGKSAAGPAPSPPTDLALVGDKRSPPLYSPAAPPAPPDVAPALALAHLRPSPTGPPRLD